MYIPGNRKTCTGERNDGGRVREGDEEGMGKVREGIGRELDRDEEEMSNKK